MIGWAPVFKGRFSVKWGEAQGIYYASNPDTQDTQRYSASIWDTTLIKTMVAMSFEMWVVRNKQLHGSTPEEQR